MTGLLPCFRYCKSQTLLSVLPDSTSRSNVAELYGIEVCEERSLVSIAAAPCTFLARVQKGFFSIFSMLAVPSLTHFFLFCSPAAAILVGVGDTTQCNQGHNTYIMYILKPKQL